MGSVGGLAVAGMGATSSAVVSALTTLVTSAKTRRGLHRRPKSPLVRRLTRSSSEGLTNLAAAIAGCRRSPALRVEWASHLAGESGRELYSWQNPRVAFGFVLGALKMRMRDVADLAWVPADHVLGSRMLSNLVVLASAMTVALIIFFRAGFVGVAGGMASVVATGTALHLLIMAGRWYRDVKPPDPRLRSKD